MKKSKASHVPDRAMEKESRQVHLFEAKYAYLAGYEFKVLCSFGLLPSGGV